MGDTSANCVLTWNWRSTDPFDRETQEKVTGHTNTTYLPVIVERNPDEHSFTYVENGGRNRKIVVKRYIGEIVNGRLVTMVFDAQMYVTVTPRARARTITELTGEPLYKIELVQEPRDIRLSIMVSPEETDPHETPILRAHKINKLIGPGIIPESCLYGFLSPNKTSVTVDGGSLTIAVDSRNGAYFFLAGDSSDSFFASNTFTITRFSPYAVCFEDGTGARHKAEFNTEEEKDTILKALTSRRRSRIDAIDYVICKVKRKTTLGCCGGNDKDYILHFADTTIDVFEKPQKKEGGIEKVLESKPIYTWDKKYFITKQSHLGVGDKVEGLFKTDGYRSAWRWSAGEIVEDAPDRWGLLDRNGRKMKTRHIAAPEEGLWLIPKKAKSRSCNATIYSYKVGKDTFHIRFPDAFERDMWHALTGQLQTKTGKAPSAIRRRLHRVIGRQKELSTLAKQGAGLRPTLTD